MASCGRLAYKHPAAAVPTFSNCQPSLTRDPHHTSKFHGIPQPHSISLSKGSSLEIGRTPFHPVITFNTQHQLLAPTTPHLTKQPLLSSSSSPRRGMRPPTDLMPSSSLASTPALIHTRSSEVPLSLACASLPTYQHPQICPTLHDAPLPHGLQPPNTHPLRHRTPFRLWCHAHDERRLSCQDREGVA